MREPLFRSAANQAKYTAPAKKGMRVAEFDKSYRSRELLNNDAVVGVGAPL